MTRNSNVREIRKDLKDLRDAYMQTFSSTYFDELEPHEHAVRYVGFRLAKSRCRTTCLTYPSAIIAVAATTLKLALLERDSGAITAFCVNLTHLFPLCRHFGSRDESEETTETSVVRAIMELSNQQHLGSCDIEKDACLKSGEQELPSPRTEGGVTSNLKEKCKKGPALRTPPTRGQSYFCPRSKPGKRMAAQSAQDANLARALQRQLNSGSATKRHRPYHGFVSIPVA